MRVIIVLLIVTFVLLSLIAKAQQWDTVNDTLPAFKSKHLIAPFTLIGIGIVGVSVPKLRDMNITLRNYIQSYDPHRIRIDDYMQYAPIVAVYSLNLLGVEGQHNFIDRTLILTTSYLSLAILVNAVKYSTRIERPGENDHNSFPSGHTATAFMGAEFLRMEYRDKSPWIGITGYTVATLVGCSRVYNNKHWVNDVIMGAGVGIMSAKIGYWLHKPVRNIFPASKKKNMMLSPYYNGNQFGAAFNSAF